MIEDDPQVEHAKMMQLMNTYYTSAPPAYYPKAVLKGVIRELLSVLKKAKFSMYSPEMIKEIEETIKKYDIYSK